MVDEARVDHQDGDYPMPQRFVSEEFNPMRALILSLTTAALLASTTAPAIADERDKGLTERQKSEVEALVRDYILKNPEIILESVAVMQARQEAEKDAQVKAALVSHKQALEADPGDPVIGNPDGDVTIVEFFDYQCGYCKSVLGPLMELVTADGNIRLVLKEFPILGPASDVAARASLAAARQGKYEAFHVALLNLRGRLSEEGIWQVAREVGLDLERLRTDMRDPEIATQIQKSYGLARTLGIEGTPAFTIGSELIPGAIGKEQMAELVAKVRAGG